ncbi:MAG: class I SAM-dependent methyltransferase [Acidimicrobiales bacterium]
MEAQVRLPASLPPGPGKRYSADRDEPLNRWLETRLWALGAGGPVLDLGCGRGYWLRRMASAGLRPIGIEDDPARTAEAGRQAPVTVADASHLPVADGSVRLVWCIHVLHHLEHPEAALAEVRRVLRPGGHIVMAETVEDNPIVRVGRRLWPAWDGVAVRSRFTAASLVAMVRAAGLAIVDQRQHSLVSFGAWALPAGDRWAWVALSRAEGILPRRLDRWGAHFECVSSSPGP